MEDEEKILLLGVGAFGALTYVALKKMEERKALEERTEIMQQKEVSVSSYGLSKEDEEEVPIYKDILELLFGRK
ncbi:MAG: hypothetical protein APG12_01046 [Candidatus Methanofastidiosum methylothiophilum]|uniref:Uncharacterized protein n=1 Tax=Candidatus Methanofastidiosum methylothiophilum TaxID=1705564 RepID=A0A150IL16_9EURY|nr:MAG: hypothetical protein APG10_00589 [Candidatus Methanofastidiosum methylthiophilus]KYC47922.1 MAG: hypothetical protein APG11_00801 [Candidatus Methanofastidiosum methylthiophilus]KYC50053.1 MAG: hypothetical protein APG12_01046 [Candidatus Methanofastidiosum methylthiophilus]